MSHSNHRPPLQLTAVQLTSSPDPSDNLATLRDLFQQLPPARPQLVVLPEACLCFGAGDERQRAIAELPGSGPMQEGLAALARDFGVWLVAGTIPLIDQPQQQRFSAASLLYNPAGECLARYNKINLFDVEVADSTGTYRESAATLPGTEIVTVTTEIGTIGMAVCYDLRFAELFRQLRLAGADIIVLPSAFTQVTGSAHWHVLTQARAIEQQCALVAAAQVGQHANGRQTYGHALVVDAWGSIQADAEHTSPSLASASFNASRQQDIRGTMPVLKQFQTQQVF
jgi:predicted amidohydrolase